MRRAAMTAGGTGKWWRSILIRGAVPAPACGGGSKPAPALVPTLFPKGRGRAAAAFPVGGRKAPPGRCDRSDPFLLLLPSPITAHSPDWGQSAIKLLAPKRLTNQKANKAQSRVTSTDGHIRHRHPQLGQAQGISTYAAALTPTGGADRFDTDPSRAAALPRGTAHPATGPQATAWTENGTRVKAYDRPLV